MAIDRKKARATALELRKGFARADRLALELLEHPDATPEQMWELHGMMVRARQQRVWVQKTLNEHLNYNSVMQISVMREK
jgi:hypothetical protein